MRYGEDGELIADRNEIDNPNNLVIAIFIGMIIYRGVVESIHFGTDGSRWIGAEFTGVGFAIFPYLGTEFNRYPARLTNGDKHRFITPSMKLIIPKLLIDPSLFDDRK